MRKQKKSPAQRLLHIEMGILLLIFGWFLAEYLPHRAYDPVYANSYYPMYAEAIVISLCLSLLSAMLLDRVLDERG